MELMPMQPRPSTRVNGLGALDLLYGDLGQTQVVGFSGRDRFSHRAEGFLDGHLGVDAVELVGRAMPWSWQ
jgi:hypothetical protein